MKWTIPKGYDRFVLLIHTQGHPQPLYVTCLRTSCGDIRNRSGVAFAFGTEGPWIVPVSELKAIVKAVEKAIEKPVMRPRRAKERGR